MVTANAIINGVGATMILVTGYLITIRLLVAIRHSESKLLPWQGLFALALGSFYTGTVVSFITLLATNNNFQPDQFGSFPPYTFGAVLCYSLAPIGIAAGMYIGFSMIKPSWAKTMAWIYGLTAIPFWANLWFNFPSPSSTVASFNPAQDLVDFELLSWSEIFTAVYIVSLIAVLGLGFIILAFRSTGDIRTRSRNYAIGLILFSVCGIIDSRGLVAEELMIYVRLLMIVAYIFLYLAMVPPKPSFPPSKGK